MSKKIQAKFYVDEHLWAAAQHVMDEQGLDYSEGMRRLLGMVLDAPPEARPIIFDQAPVDAIAVLAELILERWRSSSEARVASPMVSVKINTPQFIDNQGVTAGRLAHRDYPAKSGSANPSPRATSGEGQTNPEQWFRIVAATGTVPHLARLDIAERWSDLDVMGETDEQGVAEENWLIVAIAGDSMEPRYHDGQQVLFRVLPASEKVVVNRDYLIAREDKSATLRRVSKVSREGYELTAANPKYAPLHVGKDEARMVAEPRFIVSSVPL